jgi:diguanylate cyclase (GGDEF)-like protein
VITAFADCLTQCVGGSHLVGRIGGEEFAILMLGANVSTGRLFAEGARAAFGCLPIPGLPEHMRCTASFGVAEWREGEVIAGLFARADQALYDAKEAGRDCVRTSPGGDERGSLATGGRALGLVGRG